MVEVEFKENYTSYEYFDIRMLRNAKEELKLEPDTLGESKIPGAGA